MVDSESVGVGGEVAAWVTDVVVVDESGGECEQPECDADTDAGDGATAVSFEREWAFTGQMTDSIHWRTGPSEPFRRGSFLRSGRSKRAPRLAMWASNSSPAKRLSAMTV